MIERAMAWAGAHRNAVLIAAGLAAAFGAGWVVRGPPPQPAVALRSDTAVKKDATKDATKRDSKGPTETTKRTYRPPPPGCPPGTPPILASETTTKRGPEVIDSRVVDHKQQEEHQVVSLTVSPAALPRWALGAGIEDPLGARKVNLSIGFRVIGPVWLRAGFTPSRGSPGATIGAEVQW